MTTNNYDYDYLIIGSGFGGSVSACRLTEKGYSVAVMEMGRRWEAKDFAKNNWNTRRWIWRPGMKLFGYFNMRFSPCHHYLRERRRWRFNYLCQYPTGST